MKNVTVIIAKSRRGSSFENFALVSYLETDQHFLVGNLKPCGYESVGRKLVVPCQESELADFCFSGLMRLRGQAFRNLVVANGALPSGDRTTTAVLTAVAEKQPNGRDKQLLAKLAELKAYAG